MTISFSAVVVAAGRSQRFNESLGGGKNSKVSKTLIEYQNRPLIFHTLKALLKVPLKQIALVIRLEEQARFESVIADLNTQTQFVFAAGGARRQDSVRNGLVALTQNADRVLIHDAARPNLSENFLFRLLDKAASSKAVIPVLPIYETVKELNDEKCIVKTHKREKLMGAQTPQIFDLEVIRSAHLELKDSDQEFTDDSAILESRGDRIDTVLGDPLNIKVTVAQDLEKISHV